MMESLARDLWILAQLLWKVGWMTGLLPGILLAALWLRYNEHLDQAKVIPFPESRRRRDALAIH